MSTVIRIPAPASGLSDNDNHGEPRSLVTYYFNLLKGSTAQRPAGRLSRETALVCGWLSDIGFTSGFVVAFCRRGSW